MRYLLTVFFPLLLIGGVSASEPDKEIVTFAPSDDGRVQVFSIPRSEAQRLPTWVPGTEEPPLSVGQAVNAAREWLKSLGDGSGDLPLADIHVLRKRDVGAKSAGRNDIWFYHLFFSTSPKRRSDVVKSTYVVVLMDGRILTSEFMTEEEFQALLLRR